MAELPIPPLQIPMTPLRKRLAAIDANLNATPTSTSLSKAVHAMLKLLDDMEVARIKDFQASITEVVDAPHSV